MTEEPATLDELEANADFVKKKSEFLGLLLDVLIDAKPHIDSFGLDYSKFNALVDHLSEELMGNEAERQVVEKDLQKELWLLQ